MKNPSRETKQFLELFTPNYRRIYAFILNMLPNLNDAEDVMQETSQILWEKFDSYTPGTNFMAWALTIARYQVLRYLKQKRNTVSLGDHLTTLLAEEFPKQQDLVPDRLGALQQCIKRLKSDDQEHIRLRFRDEFSPKVLARLQGVHVKRVYRREATIMGLLLRCVRRSLFKEGIA